jgi:hypothetical protein
MADDERWTLFPPKASFSAQDDYDFRGTKTWEYVIIPRKTGSIAVPNLSLTYFNPETEHFETTAMDNGQRTVLVSRSGEALFGYENSTTGEKPKQSSDVTSAPIHILTQDTMHHQTLLPLYRQSWFWILQGFLVLLALLFAIRIKKPSLRKRKPNWNINRIRKLLTQNAQSGDAEQFYKTASLILDQRLSMFGIALDQERSEQIRQLHGKKIKHLKWLETFLNEADAIAFGRLTVDGEHSKRQLEKVLLFLEQRIDKI